MVGYVLRQAAGNALLLFQVKRLARAVGGIHRAGFDAYTAMHTAHTAFISQGIQIPPNGLRCHRKVVGELFDTHVAVLTN